MVIDRRDRVINLCEMKFSINEFTIEADYNENLRNKIDAFHNATGTAKAVQIVLVTTYGLKNNSYSSIVQKTVI